MSIKRWCECMFKKLFNTKIKLFANKHSPHSSKCKPSWYKSVLELFPISIKTKPFLLHISTIFSLTFLITVYGSLLIKAIPETKRSITSNDLHLLTMLAKFDIRLTVLLDDLSFSRSFIPTCNIELRITIFYLLLKVPPHSYSSDGTSLKNNHFFDYTVVRVT